MSLLIQDSDGSNPLVNDTFTADGSGMYSFSASFSGGPSIGTLTVSGNADPDFTYSLTLQNTRGDGMPSIYDFGVAIEMVQFFSLSEGDIANNFTTLQDMDLGGTVMLADGEQIFAANATSPAPDLSLGLGDWSEMGTPPASS